MKLKLAYRKMMMKDGVNGRLKMPRQTFQNRKHEAKDGRFPSERTMRSRLLAAGWRCVQHELWRE